jgi:hypothetical protein
LIVVKLLDPNTPGYDRWCEAAKRAHAGWNTTSPESREPWIVEARQKEIDSEAARAARAHCAAGGFDPLKPGVIPPVPKKGK